jgi:hypothetical protein
LLTHIFLYCHLLLRVAVCCHCHPLPSIPPHCLLLPFVHHSPNPRCSFPACTISALDQSATEGMRKLVIYRSSVSGHLRL